MLWLVKNLLILVSTNWAMHVTDPFYLFVSWMRHLPVWLGSASSLCMLSMGDLIALPGTNALAYLSTMTKKNYSNIHT